MTKKLNETAQAIVTILDKSSEPMTAKQVAASLGLTVPRTVSNLNKLKEMNIVEQDKDGNKHYFLILNTDNSMSEEKKDVGVEVNEKAESAKEVKKTKAKKEPKEKKEKKPKGPGVIASILEVITNAEKPGVAQSDILAELKKRFPEKVEKSMINTIRAQIGSNKRPLRMEKEKGVEFEITENKDKVKLYMLKK